LRVALSLLLISITILFLTSCSDKKNVTDNDYKYPKIIYSTGENSKLTISDYQLNGDIIISLDKEKYTTQDSLTYSIANNTNTTLYIQTNDVFFLEKKVDNEWKKVLFNIIPSEQDLGQEIQSLTKNKPLELSTRTLDDWLNEGTFRIVRIVSKSPTLSTNDFTLLSNEFTVSKLN
jgi:hypothetical protein